MLGKELAAALGPEPPRRLELGAFCPARVGSGPPLAIPMVLPALNRVNFPPSAKV